MTFRAKQSKVYDEREVILAYLAAFRPPYPHEDFQRFWKDRLAALESAYGIQMGREGIKHRNGKVLSILFFNCAASLRSWVGPYDMMLESSLLDTRLRETDNEELKLLETQARLHEHLREARKAAVDLLVSLFIAIWGPITNPLTSAELAARGFDDSKEPKIQDYYYYM